MPTATRRWLWSRGWSGEAGTGGRENVSKRLTTGALLLGLVALLISACDDDPASMGFSVSAGGRLEIHPVRCGSDDIGLGVRVVDTGETNVQAIDPQAERTIWEVRSTEGAVTPPLFTLGITPAGWNVTHEYEEPTPLGFLRVYLEESWASGKIVTVRELVRMPTLESGRIRVGSRSLTQAEFADYVRDEGCP